MRGLSEAMMDNGCNKPRISVIIPVFYKEKHIGCCLESVLTQSFEKIEVVAVDDGSSDSSAEIVERYGERDSRIHLIKKRNGGASEARNKGIEASSGDYLFFMDADDWIEREELETLYKQAVATKADICFSGYRLVSRGTTIRTLGHPFGDQTLIGSDQMSQFRAALFGSTGHIKERVMPITACAALFSSQLIKDNDIRFLKTRHFEDLLFNIYACRAANRIACNRITGYCYRKDGQSSTSNNFDVSDIDNLVSACDMLVSEAKKEPKSNINECLQGSYRMVLRSSRLMMAAICHENCSSVKKRNLMINVLNEPIIKLAHDHFPKAVLPFWEKCFFVSMRCRSFIAIRTLVGSRDIALSARHLASAIYSDKKKTKGSLC